MPKRVALELPLRPHQREVLNSLERFNVLSAHRRFGKTVVAVFVLIQEVLKCQLPRPTVHYYAPSYGQAKKVAWEYVKQYCQVLDPVVNESELKVTIPGNRVIQLGSSDNPDSSRGIYSDFAVLDEPAQMPTKMFTEILRPALSDRKGGGLMIGTPQGRHGLFYDSYQNAQDDPEWWRGMYKASETGIIDPIELESARKSMSKAEYAQEYECSWDSAIQGAYWGETVNIVEGRGQITKVTHRPDELVYTAWDLGVNDATAIWYFQLDGDQIRVIDHDEFNNMGLPQIMGELLAKGYRYGKAILPHDGRNRSLSTGRTRIETLESLGLESVVAPKANNQNDIADHIDVSRTVIYRTWFDRDNCKHGLECLRQYRSIWDTKKGVARLTPLHDFTSHSADAWRYLCTTDLDLLTDTWGGELIYNHVGRH